MQLAVLGAGAWGTALAIEYARGHQVTLWTRDSQQQQDMAAARVNQRYLPDAPFPDALQLSADLAGSVTGAGLILIVTPIAGLRPTLKALRALGQPLPPLIWACKGFEQQTGLLPHQVVVEELPDLTCFGALSGPSFAQELAQGLPCAVCLASWEQEWLESLTSKLNTPVMRLYSNNDLIGMAFDNFLTGDRCSSCWNPGTGKNPDRLTWPQFNFSTLPCPNLSNEFKSAVSTNIFWTAKRIAIYSTL